MSKRADGGSGIWTRYYGGDMNIFKMILFAGILAMAISCGSAGLPEKDLPEEAVDFQFTDGTSMSSNTADEHHPVMLGNHFYYVSDVGADSFVHHAVLQPGGKFQNLGRLQNNSSADVNLKDLGAYMTNECQIGAGNNSYWDMHGVTMQDGQSFLIFGRRIDPTNDNKQGICVAPLDGNGEILWGNVKLYLLGNDTGSVCATPIAVGFMVTDDNNMGVFQNFGGTGSAGITFQKLAYNTGTKSIVPGGTTSACLSGKKMPTKLITVPVPVLNYPPGAFAREVRNIKIRKDGVPQMDFQILNNNGRLQLLGKFGNAPLVLDIFDPMYYEKCFINSPSIGPDKRFYFSAKCNNPQFPTQDLYRINYPTADEMGPAREIIRYILTGEKPELGIPLP